MPKRNQIIPFLFLLAFTLNCQSISTAQTPPVNPISPISNTYYVAPDGDDTHPGTLAEPWQTIQHAADTVTAGDAVNVRAGVYHERVTVNVSGTAGATIVFQSFPGETAILDGAGLTVPDADNGLFFIENQSYLVLSGFELRNYTTDDPNRVPIGIFVTGAAHHIELRNNHLHHIENNGGSEGNAHGIAIYGTEAPDSIHDVLIDGNELHDLKLGNSEALVLNGNVEQFTITNNHVHDNDNIGIDLIGFEGTAPDPDYDQARDGIVADNTVHHIDTLTNPAYFGEQSAAGIYVDGGTRIVIERNRVYASNFGVELASEHAGRATSFITVRNNFFYHNHGAGLAMGGYDTARGSTHHCDILNNTFFENDTNQYGTGELYLQFDTHDNRIVNNLFYANEQSLFTSNDYVENTANLVDYNLYFAPAGIAESEWGWKTEYYTGFDAYRTATGNDPHSLFADPEFVNLSQPDLHLQATSPARDRGQNLPEAGTSDIDHDPRLQNGTVDLGADEYAPTTGNQSVFLPFVKRE
ncbi:MAG: right-handed parallel beta-helix repeat-containing protein [Anaerolineales bacterium]|nr:right-handed parallel beta-helix repeat-containing protein [Anaerolineales bacterium]